MGNAPTLEERVAMLERSVAEARVKLQELRADFALMVAAVNAGRDDAAA